MSELLYRSCPIRVGKVNSKRAEVEFIIATENPADMGWGDPEILLVSGMRVRDAERGVPLLNAHNRYNVLDVLGRVADVRVEERQVHATYRFSKATQQARDAFGLVEDGSIDAASIGYQIIAFREVREGETFEAEGEDPIEGPAVVVTEWELKESSLVPIGADAEALKRALGSATRSEDMAKAKKKTAKKASKKAAKADDEDEDDAEDDADKAKADDDGDGDDDSGDDGDDSTDDEGEGDGDSDEDDEEDEDDSAKSLDAIAAKAIEDRKRLIFAFTPADLRGFADGLVVENPEITPEAARAALLAERAKRLQPIGTPEPTRAGDPTPKAPPNAGASTEDETGAAALSHLIREVS